MKETTGEHKTEASASQILEKAIQVAKSNGWTALWPYSETPYKASGKNEWFVGDGTSVRAFLFDHEFAKALWGEEQNTISLRGIGATLRNWEGPAYKMHLMQMVVSEDPVKYLGESI